uniref:Discoidin, CUB and LCCL domain-containing protein 2 n=1 Tax=Rattus norvegicus TaxID=10116 RepID=DCBD2_RAT|nr:RecName: Full=Discoidin, CUB and LCCL domain-containing protein 2; AltName: Full=Endothelial and smooth muscle cell-derived neuropilin-like protein; Flags: Precursor [Rattus norvegicus]AAL30180.1 endothelial and smooth muscle cell-derived neuropilin-like protein [Rattus norvegicus]|eukprot:NP_569103.1 discoidin, CUB and LCCL domain-containing protein 2 precursor [Rattus norvegicus]
MASRAPLRAARSPQDPGGRAAPAATGRAPLPSAGWCPLPPGRNSSSRPRLLLLLLLLLPDAGAQKGDGCGHTVLGPESGTLTSINYPHTYPNSTVCKWEIRVKTGERIRIKFGDFDIEDSDYCHLNYLKIFNGIGVSRTEIGKYCGLGLQMNQSIESKGSEITVLFMSGIHASGRGFLASYSVIDKQDLITCLDTVSNFLEPEFSKYCPAGCLLPFAEISGTIPHGYRDSSPLCMAGIHAGVVSDVLGGQISVVISKGTPYYESSLANNVTSMVGYLSTSLFTFKTSGCYGTLGMESGVIADPQITASSVLEWTDHMGQENSWKPEKARLRKPGPPWAAFATDEHQWLQIDLNKEKKITGIVTTGSTLIEHNYYVSAYRVLYSDDGQKWTVYREPGAAQDKIFQGNKDYHKDVRNNFLPPIIARFIRVNPVQWQQKIAMKVELLGCQFTLKGRLPKLTQPPPPRNSNNLKNTTVHPKLGRAPKFTQALQPRSRNDLPLLPAQTTATPDVKNTTVTPSVTKDVALAAVLVPVLVMALTTLILILVCAWHWRNRKKKAEGTYDLPHWDRAGWWKGVKQLLPAKSVEHEETPVRYSNSEVSHLSPREVTTVLQADSAEYAQPLVGGIVGTLHQRSTFKPEEGKEASYADLDPYNAPVQEVYHAYAEPLPVTGPEYATPIVMDMSGHSTASVGLPSTSTFRTAGNQPPALVGTYNTLLSRTDSCSSGQAQYDTPKGGKPAAAPEELVYQVPQSTQEASGAGRDEKFDAFKETL